VLKVGDLVRVRDSMKALNNRIGVLAKIKKANELFRYEVCLEDGAVLPVEGVEELTELEKALC